jgi:hypothetical protein
MDKKNGENSSNPATMVRNYAFKTIIPCKSQAAPAEGSRSQTQQRASKLLVVVVVTPTIVPATTVSKAYNF